MTSDSGLKLSTSFPSIKRLRTRSDTSGARRQILFVGALSLLLFANHSWNSWSLFARFLFDHSIFDLRAFLCAQQFLYTIHSEKLTISLFARHSEKRWVLFFFRVGPIEHIKRRSLQLTVIVDGESDISSKKTLCLVIFRPQDLLSHEPTLWFRRYQLFWFGRTIFLQPQTTTKYWNNCR